MQMRNPKEVEKTEYNEFYKKTFNEFLDPLAYTHFTTEVGGFRSLLLFLLFMHIKHMNMIYILNRERWNFGVFSMSQGWHLLVMRR